MKKDFLNQKNVEKKSEIFCKNAIEKYFISSCLRELKMIQSKINHQTFEVNESTEVNFPFGDGNLDSKNKCLPF